MKISPMTNKIYLRFIWEKVFSSLRFGQIFIAVNGQILKTQSGHLVTLVRSIDG